MFKKLFSFIIVIFSTVIIIGSFRSEAIAQAYRGLIIDELIIDLGYVQPGQTITRSFNVTHDFQQADKYVTIYPRAADFESNGINGDPVLLPAGTKGEAASLASWVTYDLTSFSLDHYKQVQNIVFTVTVPENAEPGSKYAALLLSDKEGQGVVGVETEESKLGLSKELGPLLILTVDGEITKGLVAEDLYTTDIKDKKTRFFLNAPVNIISILRNTGNVYTTPKGKIYVYKGDNFQTYEQAFELNESGSLILGNSTRYYAFTSFGLDDSFMVDTLKTRERTDPTTGEITEEEYVGIELNWDRLSKLRIGKYSIKLLYSTENTDGTVSTLEKDASFWIIPWPLIVLALIIIGIISIWIIIKRSQSKSKKKSKIAKE